MRKLVAVLAVSAALMVFSAPSANAGPITGSVTFGGFWQPTGGTGAINATGVDIIGNVASVTCSFPIPNGCTGSYQPLAGPIGVAYNDFSFAPLGGGLTPLWSFVFNGLTYSFDLQNVVIVTQTAVGIILSGSGVLHITGFDDTFGTWSFSGDFPGGTGLFAFSSSSQSTAVVPEPGSLLLLGSGLAGLAAAARRRLKGKSKAMRA